MYTDSPLVSAKIVPQSDSCQFVSSESCITSPVNMTMNNEQSLSPLLLSCVTDP